jgi:hypothetical protein
MPFAALLIGSRNAMTQRDCHVVSVRPPSPSAATRVDLATPLVFTDDPIVAGVTPMRVIHLTGRGLTAGRLCEYVGHCSDRGAAVDGGAGMTIKAAHVRELRSAVR